MRTTRQLSPLAVLFLGLSASANPPVPPPPKDPLDAAIPNTALMMPFKDVAPIVFVTRTSNPAVWAKLPAYWNESTEEAADPITGAKVKRRLVTIKVPLGLATAPAVPSEDPITVAKWELGKRLYYDKTLSSNNTIACASCHSPTKDFTDQRKTSLGINEKLGGMNAPTIINSAYNRFQFWDGRASSLAHQAQGPVGNPLEMFGGKGEPWEEAILRLRSKPDYIKAFKQVFGSLPTRDAAAKAIATYERTVLSGNSIHDRADVLMRKRVADEETGKYEFTAADYAAAVKDAFKKKDQHSLTALGLDPAKDSDKADAIGKKLVRGRTLFFGKARCSNCHVGDRFTDDSFHNLGVGVQNGKLIDAAIGRYARLMTGHKDATMMGAFKTPSLRALVGTQPYMHDGMEKTLAEVIDFYDKGGNANEFLDAKMRDVAAEEAYLKAKAEGKSYTGPQPALFTRGGRPIIPMKLNLSADEKAALVLFLQSLQGDPVDAIVADPQKFPAPAALSQR